MTPSTRWADEAPAPVAAAGAVVGPLIVFALVLAGLAIERAEAFVVFLVVVAVATVIAARIGVAGQLQRFAARNRRISALTMIVLVAAFPLTQLGEPVWIRVAALGAVFSALALGLNIVVGRAGLLDLGYAAFFGIGAYSGAMLSTCSRCPVHAEVPWIAALVISGVIGAIFGVLLGFPVLRLRGDYLAIVTLGFGEIVRVSLNNLDQVPIVGGNLTNGPNGLFGVADPKLGPLDLAADFTLFGWRVPNVTGYYYVAAAIVLMIVVVVRRIDRSRIGRAWTAIREDEEAARAMGINTTRTKLLAFAAGAFFGGLAGNVFVHLQSGTSPEDFTFLVSVTVLAMVVLGGMGNPAGVILGSVLLVMLPEKLRFVDDYRFLIFGLVLIVMMRFRPEGLLPEVMRRRELHEPEMAAAS